MSTPYVTTKIAAAIALLLAGPSAFAADTLFDDFTPLVGDTTPLNPGSDKPYRLSSPNFSQETIADRATQNTLVPGSNSGNWDMIAANETGPNAGRYLFAPFETGTGGVQRIDLWDGNYNTRTTTIVAPGTQGFVAGDASRWTPWGGYLTAEESWGAGSTKGRLFEVTDPTTATASGANFVQRSVIPRVSHEGLAFDASKALYFVDELNGGSIYKYVSANPNATSGADFFAAGQTFALKVGAGGQFEGNNGPAITGIGSWEAITDLNGGALAGISTVLADGTVDGRATADNASVLGTGYNRPEDLEIQTLANGNQFLYFTTTDSDDDGVSSNGRGRVYSLNVGTNEVKLFAGTDTLDLATGGSAGAAGFKNPDNLAIDAAGNIYIVEDQDGGVEDVWLAKDENHDGVAEGIGKWISLTTAGAESTGLYFDLFNPNKAYINVQHPADGIDRTIALTATAPVPVPGAVWLFGSALAGIVGLRRRKA
ncbi:alkaline phosphatase PhoX [Methylococcus sp. EFPC2]|uniref:alkaline phosphatase PhoX n=1 Tax=Methylococcus sp. EFPC2 TaxID=2812648 RepID=UPI0019678244|nr:alkaline phosphatase PhoX [Methylococcus sp. EFPC2]QSA97408.1 DUF839 domain-containing protein [Methylococcus sp. EFPC2]